MRWPRRFVSAWWLTLIVVSCLFARPMHEWLDAVQASAATVSVPAALPSDLQASAWQGGHGPAADAAQDSSILDDGSPDDGSHDDGSPEEGTQTTACAWCLMLGQAQAPAAAPVLLLARAEACPPPVTLEPGRPTGRCTLAAEPRGPPQG